VELKHLPRLPASEKKRLHAAFGPGAPLRTAKITAHFGTALLLYFFRSRFTRTLDLKSDRLLEGEKNADRDEGDFEGQIEE
jgi:hypothetical protein